MIAAFVQGAASVREGYLIVQMIGYTILEWGLLAAAYSALLNAFPATSHLSIFDAVVFLGFVSFGGTFQIPGVGGGMQLVSVIVLTEMFGIPLEVATGMSIVIWIITFVVVLPFGILAAFQEHLSFRKIMSLKEESRV